MTYNSNILDRPAAYTYEPATEYYVVHRNNINDYHRVMQDGIDIYKDNVLVDHTGRGGKQIACKLMFDGAMGLHDYIVIFEHEFKYRQDIINIINYARNMKGLIDPTRG